MRPKLSPSLDPVAAKPSSSVEAAQVDILLLGSGWTSSFLLPIAGQRGFSTAFTTRDGRDGSLRFNFDPDSDSLEPFKVLPEASTVVVIFPLYDPRAIERLVKGYESTRSDEGLERQKRSNWILLGSTGIWDGGPTLSASLAHSHSPWINRNTPLPDNPPPRAITEQAFLALSKSDNNLSARPFHVSVLNLCGLWGHGRSPRRFVSVVASSKEALRNLSGVCLVHGRDVARAIIAMHENYDRADGERWILTNGRNYDWWDLASRWGDAGEQGRDHPPTGPQPKWVSELIQETHECAESCRAVLGLPRSVEQMGSGLEGMDFWTTFDLTPDVPDVY
ncbi:hypothetical protein IE53DRAFT_314344 [Violaceomyces palustris]|uniref:Uncharacterized protein n=1 Tax=Violaceomyces palustris TaxID=1673888 RepID=A0ACD0NZD2_9BASI|nr:hypothetical protein IE53DRAFT_314344 [Violaceomyces palustris]